MNKKNSKNASNKNNRANKNKIQPDKMMRINEDIPNDILGSYTGVPADEYEQPVQDADDL